MLSLVPSLTESQERSLLNALLTNEKSLPDLAASLDLSLLDLLELISSPSIQSRLIAFEQAAYHAVRAAASAHLPTILDALTNLLHSHRRDYDRLEGRADDEAVTHRRHERPHIRRAATTLLRLTRMSPLAPGAVFASLPPRESRHRRAPEPDARCSASNAHASSMPTTPPSPSINGTGPSPRPVSSSAARVHSAHPALHTPHPAPIPRPASSTGPIHSLLNRAGTVLAAGP